MLIVPCTDFLTGAFTLANHPSAQKRSRQARRRRSRNSSGKARVHGAVRAANEAIAQGNAEQAGLAVRNAMIVLARAAAAGIVHKRNAGRRTSRLARRVARLTAPAT
jgi:small subunit ribosomal protein S20